MMISNHEQPTRENNVRELQTLGLVQQYLIQICYPGNKELFISKRHTSLRQSMGKPFFLRIHEAEFLGYITSNYTKSFIVEIFDDVLLNFKLKIERKAMKIGALTLSMSNTYKKHDLFRKQQRKSPTLFKVYQILETLGRNVSPSLDITQKNNSKIYTINLFAEYLQTKFLKLVN